MKSRNIYRWMLVLFATCLSASAAHPPSAELSPATYADPAVPLMQLPTNFRARRTTANLSLTPGKPVEIFNATGTGCVRHLWYVFGGKDTQNFSGRRTRTSDSKATMA